MSTQVDLEAAHRQTLEDQQKRADKKASPNTEFHANMQAATHVTNAKLRDTAVSAGINASGHTVVGAAVQAAARAKPVTQASPAQGAAQQQASRSLITQTAPNASSVVGNTSVVGGLGTTSSAGTGSITPSGSLNSLGSTGALSATNSQNGSAQLLQATGQLQELSQQFNLQYLQLQENEQSQNRQFTALSNVSKLRNDTAKNSLSNLK